jgi:cell division initiation protein
MSISPAEIRHVRLRRRVFGLKKKDVERELDRIAESFGEVWRQRQDLEERNHEIAVELARHQEAEAMLRKTLVTAERSADVMRADARREAERIVREAEQTAREIVGEAHHERERVRHEIIRLQEKEREFRARFRAMLEATGSIVDSYEADTGEAMAVASAPAGLPAASDDSST